MPPSGRFLSQDPIGFAAGDANLYRYVSNSAANAIDPAGLEGNASGNGRGKDYVWFPAGPGAMPPPGWGPSSETIRESARQARDYYSADSLAVVLSMLCEPLDWFFTASGIYNDPSDLLNYAGLLPLVPGGARKLVSAPRTAAMRSLSERIADFQANPQNWQRVSASVEQASARTARGGVSIESVYRNPATGETLHVHDVSKASGCQLPKHPSFRDYGKGQ